MKIKYTLSVLFILIYLFSFSQGEYIVKLDRAAGSFTKTGPPIPGITYIYAEERTFDENTGTFFFPSIQLNHALYSITASNGALLNNPIIGNIYQFEYNSNTNVLYGLEQDNLNNQKNFISINKATGTYTQIGSPLPSSAMYQGFTAFNKLNNTFIFLDPPNILYSLNATNGSIVSSPSLVLAPNESIVHFCVDNSTGTIYGLMQDNIANKYFLVTINPATGVSTKIGTGSTFGAGGGSSAIDESNKQFMYLYSSPSAGGYVVTTLDMTNGNVLFNSLVQPYTLSDNFFSLQYHNATGNLYSIHWETLTTGITEQNKSENDIKIYPNPNSGSFKLQLSNEIENGEMILCNSLGQKVYEQKIIQGINSVNTIALSKGLYHYSLLENKQQIKTGKFIIE